MPWKVFYTDEVIAFLTTEITSKRVYEQINQYREILSLFPDIGRKYDPLYDAARPPFDVWCIAIPSTPFMLYYKKDESNRTLVVFYIEHQRNNPYERF